MTDNDQLDVLIAVYLIPELAQQDFDAFVKLAEDRTITTDGVVLVTKDADGEVDGAGDGRPPRAQRRQGRRGRGTRRGALRAAAPRATAVGAAAGAVLGKVARKRVQAGIGEKMDDALPPGSAGIIAIYDHDDADAVAGALGNSIRSSIAQIDKASAKELKAGLEEASAGLAG